VKTRVHLFGSGIFAVQLTMIVAALAVMALMPPRNGSILLVPLWPGAMQGMAAQAIQRGALLIDRGPFPNSLIVSGNRSQIAQGMLARGVLVIAAPGGGCNPDRSHVA
jgi:hypothetical protein